MDGNVKKDGVFFPVAIVYFYGGLSLLMMLNLLPWGKVDTFTNSEVCCFFPHLLKRDF